MLDFLSERGKGLLLMLAGNLLAWGMFGGIVWFCWSLSGRIAEYGEELHRRPIPQCTQAEADRLGVDVYHCLPPIVQNEAWTVKAAQ